MVVGVGGGGRGEMVGRAMVWWWGVEWCGGGGGNGWLVEVDGVETGAREGNKGGGWGGAGRWGSGRGGMGRNWGTDRR